jgi:hypothetical protein
LELLLPFFHRETFGHFQRDISHRLFKQAHELPDETDFRAGGSSSA